MYALGIGGAFLRLAFLIAPPQGRRCTHDSRVAGLQVRPAWTAILWHMWERTRLFLRKPNGYPDYLDPTFGQPSPTPSLAMPIQRSP